MNNAQLKLLFLFTLINPDINSAQNKDNKENIKEKSHNMPVKKEKIPTAKAAPKKAIPYEIIVTINKKKYTLDNVLDQKIQTSNMNFNIRNVHNMNSVSYIMYSLYTQLRIECLRFININTLQMNSQELLLIVTTLAILLTNDDINRSILTEEKYKMLSGVIKEIFDSVVGNKTALNKDSLSKWKNIINSTLMSVKNMTIHINGKELSKEHFENMIKDEIFFVLIVKAMCVYINARFLIPYSELLITGSDETLNDILNKLNEMNNEKKAKISNPQDNKTEEEKKAEAAILEQEETENDIDI